MSSRGHRSAPGPEAEATFATLRSEISDRSGHQQSLLALNLTAVAGIAGFVLSNAANPLLLLILPVVSSAIGLLWYDHARNIDSLGNFMRTDEQLAPFSRYEERIAELERSERRRVPMTIALSVLFVGAPVAALVLTLPGVLTDDPQRHVRGLLWPFWALGLVMTASCSWYLVRFLLAGGRRPDGSKASAASDVRVE